MGFYPKIEDTTVLTLQVVVKGLEKDPEYLDREDCPYSPMVKDFFRQRQVAVGGEVVDLFEGGNDLESFEAQVKAVLNDLETTAKALSDPQDKLTYFKTKTSLVEKLIEVRERVFNLKEIAQFRDVLIEAIDQICTKDQTTEIMKRLDGVLSE